MIWYNVGMSECVSHGDPSAADAALVYEACVSPEARMELLEEAMCRLDEIIAIGEAQGWSPEEIARRKQNVADMAEKALSMLDMEAAYYEPAAASQEPTPQGQGERRGIVGEVAGFGRYVLSAIMGIRRPSEI